MRLSRKLLKELLHYDPGSGIWTRLKSRRTDLVGKQAGSLTADGYVAIFCAGKNYLAHQLAWFYMTGRWVPEIDHEDTVKMHNEWNNLRSATRGNNRANSRLAKNNKLGVKGVRKYKNRYQARIRVRTKEIYLGYYATIEEAAAAYAIAARKHHGEFARVK
jgi:hypothetical protein